MLEGRREVGGCARVRAEPEHLRPWNRGAQLARVAQTPRDDLPKLLGCTLTRLVDATRPPRRCKQLRAPRRDQFERSAILSSGAVANAG